MLPQVLNKLYQLVIRLANIGVSNDLSFQERKKTQVLNLCISVGLVPKSFFIVKNALQGEWILFAISLTVLVGGIVILVLHNYHRFAAARSVIVFGCSLFALSAIFYRNGGEYFLLTNLIIIIVFFNDTKYLAATSISCAALFIGIKLLHYYSDFNLGSVPFSRYIFNVGWAITILVLTLWYFKREDLSYQKEVEQKNQELETLNRSKETMFSIIAHDLRSPIAQLKGSLELVSHDYINQETFSQIAGKLSQQVDQLHNTLDNLLRWSLSQLQGITAKPEKTELLAILESKQKMLGQALEEKNIRLRIPLLETYVWADPDHLKVILRNLLSNAIKYSYRDSEIWVDSHAENGFVAIIIRDTGAGMNESLKASILHSDTVLSRPGTANEKGTGLGLKLCREFIAKNNGRLAVESEENKGSSFFVYLPEAH